MTNQASGVHLIGDLVNCSGGEFLVDCERLRQRCLEAVEQSGLTAVGCHFHSFGKEDGVTGMILLAESHLSLHTWPEISYVSLDIFVCNYTQDNSEKAHALFETLCSLFQPEKDNKQIVTRGPQLRHRPWLGEEVVPGVKVSLQAEGAVTSIDGLQHSVIFDNARFGKVFMLDNVFMTSEKDEFFYHENLVHPAAVAHPDPRRALIIGGGDGLAARELFRHPSMEAVTNVDIDGQVFEIGRSELAHLNGNVFTDARFTPIAMDGRRFMDDSEGQYDLIILDLTDPNQYSLPVYTKEFYASCRRRLSPGGFLSLHAESPFLRPRTWRRIIASLQAAFPVVVPSVVPIPLYGGFWSMATASVDADVRELSEQEIDQRIETRRLALKYYNGSTHRAMHGLPNFMRRMLASEAEPITEENPPADE